MIVLQVLGIQQELIYIWCRKISIRSRISDIVGSKSICKRSVVTTRIGSEHFTQVRGKFYPGVLLLRYHIIIYDLISRHCTYIRAQVMQKDSLVGLLNKGGRLGERLKMIRFNGNRDSLSRIMGQNSLQIYTLHTRLGNREHILVADAIICAITLLTFQDYRQHHAGSISDIKVIHRHQHIERIHLLRKILRNMEHHCNILACSSTVNIGCNPCRNESLSADRSNLDLPCQTTVLDKQRTFTLTHVPHLVQIHRDSTPACR